MSTGIPEKVRDAVVARSGGICEACGQARATEMHHRQYRSRDGAHAVENLLHLCGWGNHTGCHGEAHDVGAAARGLSISSGDDPLLVPVDHALFGRVLLTAEGGWEPWTVAGAGAVSSAWDSPISSPTKVATDWSLS